MSIYTDLDTLMFEGSGKESFAYSLLPYPYFFKQRKN